MIYDFQMRMRGRRYQSQSEELKVREDTVEKKSSYEVIEMTS